MPGYESMNTAELMDEVFDVYKKTFAKQLAFSALVGVISFVLMIVLGVAAAMIVIMPAINEPETAMIGMMIAMLAVMLPIYWIWTATASAGYILLSKQAFYRQHPRLPVRQLPGITLRVLSASFMQLLLSIPWLLLIILIIWLMLRSSGATNLNDPTALIMPFTSGTWVVLSIAIALLYVVYTNVFALSIPAAIFEKKYFHQTITRSWKRIKGEFWKILAIRLLWSVVVYLFTYSAQGLWVLIMSIVNTVSDSTMGASLFINTAVSLLQSLFTIVVGFLIGPLGGILTALLYFNQRIKREGLDIEITLEQLSKSLPLKP